MSFSGLLFFGMCWGCYKLGFYQATNPGEVERLGRLAWERLGRWLSK
ncbi:MAG: hypothetical protein K2Y37_02975 [Pirellulales bacterium]|nr:hypothetical protein [Pirellulales bacterium]